MNLQDSNILLLGANGGIGSALATQLSAKGARLLLAGLGQQQLDELAQTLSNPARGIHVDITRAEERSKLLDLALDYLGNIDVLINAAGVLDFLPFADLSPERIELTFRVNTLSPILLIQAALPAMQAAGKGRIVNIGSIFGSIAFPYFSIYSASKFALRGFSEALRRELDGSGVGVSYVAPRATRTPLNDARVMAMGEATRMNMDTPERVAAQIVRVIERDRDEAYLGQPESLFVRINHLMPRLVDRALRGQRRIMEAFARP
ncbi:MAG: SDR family oxidoreductase [Gammaproteobacteria bacterium]|nr:MAG: SDR family oxidoreductase [Gammaproteobacteria bacterium]